MPVDAMSSCAHRVTGRNVQAETITSMSKSKIILLKEPKIYLLRAQLAGVHCGELVEYDRATRHATLKNACRIWRWRGSETWTLTELAIRGASMKEYTRISMRAPGEQQIAEVFELLEVTDPAIAENLRTPRWLS